MEKFIKKNDILNLFIGFQKEKIELKLLAVDYSWGEANSNNFCDIYVIADLEKISEVRLIASGDGEMWDLELPFDQMEVVMENNNKYGLFKLNLDDAKIFPRTFVIKGIGTSEIYDNNEGRNYSIKKGRGGNYITKKKKIILLNSIKVYCIFDK